MTEFVIIVAVVVLLAVIAWHDEAFSPDQFTQAAGLVTGILDGLPEYVRQQRAESAQGQ